MPRPPSHLTFQNTHLDMLGRRSMLNVETLKPRGKEKGKKALEEMFESKVDLVGQPRFDLSVFRVGFVPLS